MRAFVFHEGRASQREGRGTASHTTKTSVLFLSREISLGQEEKKINRGFQLCISFEEKIKGIEAMIWDKSLLLVLCC